MCGYPQFSFWISITLVKIYIFCIIINRGKNTFELVGTVLNVPISYCILITVSCFLFVVIIIMSFFPLAVWRCHCFAQTGTLYWPLWSAMIPINTATFWHFAAQSTHWSNKPTIHPTLLGKDTIVREVLIVNIFLLSEGLGKKASFGVFGIWFLFLLQMHTMYIHCKHFYVVWLWNVLSDCQSKI